MATSIAQPIRALAEEVLLDSVFSLERPVSVEGLSFLPIIRRETQNQEVEYTNAAQALEQGVLELIEGGDAVNTIIARNKGQIPILIEEAEVLSAGGSQDRLVVASVLLQPGETRRIPVKCVHAPHSLYRGAGFRTIGAATSGLREELRKQKYCSIMTDVEHYVPETAVDQGVIWARVRDYCDKVGTTDPNKYTEALERLRRKAKQDAERVLDGIPDRTCGVIVIDSSGEVIALEMYRLHEVFMKRAGFIESILIEYGRKDARTMEDEVAWARGVQLLMHLKDINDDEVIAKDGSDNLTIGLADLRGEAITGSSEKDLPRTILYCSLGK